MSTASNSLVTQVNGRTATTDDLAPIAFAGFAHFTAMQVRGGRVRGLDLHLQRLRTASLALFGRATSDDQLRAHLRSALAAGPTDVSLTATVYSRAGEFTATETKRELDVLVRTGPAASGPKGPLALAAFEHERMLPAIKHVGEIAKTYYMREAAKQGFDDAAFVDRRGRLSEASIWNLAFWDGEAVVWPEAAMLTGTTLGIVRRQLQAMGIPQRVQEISLTNLPQLRGAVVMNSWTPAVPVSRIGSVKLPEAPAFLDTLRRAYEFEPLVEI
ncbi:aminotransferase class IV family protein [Peristeroidobacter agariperforans]|uniref:aminotransferase class IV family protein n=1 Tax=Peristeroidobacter agariperforans TaxID=268404 RepID=UPI00101DF1A0|nr:aminotransferase class IV family protein [Peristeroidobacter agariperforans]